MLVVRSWYALCTVLLPFGTLTFFWLILYIHVHFVCMSICDRFWENDPYCAFYFLAKERKAYIWSIVCSLFQARSPFRCEVMIANAGAVPLRLTWKIASEIELPVWNCTVRILVTSLRYITSSPQCIYARTWRGISRLRDSVKGLIISVSRFLVIPRNDGTSSGTCLILGAISAERNGARASNLRRL